MGAGSRLLAFFVLLCSAGTAASLPPDAPITLFVVDAWGVEEGIPQNTVRTIDQSTDGYLWVGTQEGLVRFDGSQFTNIEISAGESLDRPHVRSVVVARDDTIWIGTFGSGVIHLGKETVTRYTKENDLPSDVIYRLLEDTKGDIWAATTEGLARLDKDGVTNFTVEDGLPDKTVYELYQDDQETLWMGLLGGGLARFRDGNIEAVAGAEMLGSDIVTAVREDRQGTLWVGTYGGGLHGFRDGKPYRRYTTEDGLADDRVFSLVQDRAGSIWIGTYNRGIQRLHDGEFETLDERHGLRDGAISALFEDSAGNLWFGTIDGGLHRLKAGQFVTYTPREGLSDPFVIAVRGTPEGDLWITTEGGGLNRFRDGRFTAFTSTSHDLPSDNLTTLFQESGGLWVGSLDAGLFRFSDGEVKQSYDRSDGLPGEMITAINQDQRGDLWVGTFSSGLARIRNGRVRIFAADDGLGATGVRAIWEDRDGKLWVGTIGGGLARRDEDRFVPLTEADGLAGNLVFTLYEDHDGALWIGTDKGISRLDDGRLASVTCCEDILQRAVFSILEDDEGFLWLGGASTVTRVSKEALVRHLNREAATPPEALVFGRSEGLRTGQGSGRQQPPAWKTPDGRLWFATNAGLAMTDPSDIRVSTDSPPVYLERVIVDGAEIPVSERIVLPPGSQRLEIHYTAVGLRAAEALRFRFRLDGVDSDWVDAGERRVAYYTGLPPGEYTFHAAAAVFNGPWSVDPAAIRIEQQPYFYQTHWFALLVVSFLIASVVMVYRLRVRNLRHRERELSRVVALRTRELEEARSRFERLSMVDGLTGVSNRRNFDEALEQEWRRAARSRSALTLIMLDIDFFKPFNDAYGHQRGDDCLRRIASAIEESVGRAGDVVARYGGEEFAVLLPDVGAEGGYRVAEKVRTGIEELAISHENSGVASVVTVSAGVSAMTPAQGGSPAELLAQADRALYRAKEAGRNQTITAD